MTRSSAVAAILWLLAVCPTRSAHAGSVVVVAIEEGDTLLDEALGRIDAELSAAALSVLSMRLSKGSDLSQLVRSRAAAAEAVGALTLVPREPHLYRLSAWEPRSGRVVEQDVKLQANLGANGAAVLALRALEVLRAGLLDLTALGRESAEPESAESAASVTASRWARAPLQLETPPTPRLRLSAGLSLLRIWVGPAPQVAPTLRVAYGGPRWTAGLGYAVTVNDGVERGAAGRADLAAQVFTLFVRREWSPKYISPFLVAGVGLLALDVSGRATPPLQGAEERLWTPAGLGGVGVVVRLGRHAGLFAEVLALGLQRAPRVHLDGAPTASAARLALGATVGLQGGL